MGCFSPWFFSRRGQVYRGRSIEAKPASPRRHGRAKSAQAVFATVMAGRGDEALLRADVPAIHVLSRMSDRQDVDARVKPGHDECECNLSAQPNASSWRG